MKFFWEKEKRTLSQDIKRQMEERVQKIADSWNQLYESDWNNTTSTNPNDSFYGSQGALPKAQQMYQSDSRASELVDTSVNLALGKGFNIKFKSPVIQKYWKDWKWSPHNPRASKLELQRTAAKNLVVSGDIFAYKYHDGDRVKVQFLNPKYIRFNPESGSNFFREGIALNEYMEPTSYYFNPYSPQRGYNPIDDEIVKARLFKAHEIIHIYRDEADDRIRGTTWLAKALLPLSRLQQMDNIVMQATRLAILFSGYWKVDDRKIDLLMKEDPTTLSDQDVVEKARIEAIMESFTKGGKSRAGFPVLTSLVEWIERKIPGLDAETIDIVYKQLIISACNGMNLSQFAANRYLDNTGYQQIRHAHVTDEVLYHHIQEYVENFLNAVIDELWIPEMTELYRDFRREDTSYEIYIPVLPYVDPVKEEAARKLRVDMGITSRQQEIRNEGGSPEQIMKDNREYLDFMANKKEVEQNEN